MSYIVSSMFFIILRRRTAREEMEESWRRRSGEAGQAGQVKAKIIQPTHCRWGISSNIDM